MEKRITFSDKELKEALEKYFKIKKGSIFFWHIRSIMGNNHVIDYKE